jgi:hypothetical protein
MMGFEGNASIEADDQSGRQDHSRNSKNLPLVPLVTSALWHVAVILLQPCPVDNPRQESKD